METKAYGKTELEEEGKELLECREIVKRILDFGVSQKQILQLIYLFSLELEDVSKMQKISALVKDLKNGDSFGGLVMSAMESGEKK